MSVDWAAEKKRLEDVANNTRNALEVARFQVQEMEREMFRLEGEYRLVQRLDQQKEVKPDAPSGGSDPNPGRSDLSPSPA